MGNTYSAHGVAKRTTEFATRGWEVCFESDKYYSRLKVLQQGSDSAKPQLDNNINTRLPYKIMLSLMLYHGKNFSHSFNHTMVALGADKLRRLWL